MSRGATTTTSAFRRSVRVSIDVDATAERAWQLSTDADAFPARSSTVTKGA